MAPSPPPRRPRRLRPERATPEPKGVCRMEQSWRWFGPGDVVPLHAIRQAGASGVVTALHQIPYGVVWSIAEIEAHKALIEADPSFGLRWNVVESLPIH